MSGYDLITDDWCHGCLLKKERCPGCQTATMKRINILNVSRVFSSIHRTGEYEVWENLLGSPFHTKPHVFTDIQHVQEIADSWLTARFKEHKKNAEKSFKDNRLARINHLMVGGLFTAERYCDLLDQIETETIDFDEEDERYSSKLLTQLRAKCEDGFSQMVYEYKTHLLEEKFVKFEEEEFKMIKESKGPGRKTLLLSI